MKTKHYFLRCDDKIELVTTPAWLKLTCTMGTYEHTITKDDMKYYRADNPNEWLYTEKLLIERGKRVA